MAIFDNFFYSLQCKIRCPFVVIHNSKFVFGMFFKIVKRNQLLRDIKCYVFVKIIYRKKTKIVAIVNDFNFHFLKFSYRKHKEISK